jgi:hypothetical protein
MLKTKYIRKTLAENSSPFTKNIHIYKQLKIVIVIQGLSKNTL